MTRDLDQLEAALPGGHEPAAPYSVFDPKAAKHSTDVTAGGGSRRLVAIIGVVVAVVLLVGAVAAVVGNRIGGPSTRGRAVARCAPADPGDPGPQDVDDPQPDPPAGPAYSLTAKGITDWLAAYRQKFGTSLVYELTFYENYVIVNAPVPGKARQSGWLYREDRTWTGFGGVRATFPGAALVNTRRLDIPALMRNITRARRTLNVEQPAQAYVIVRFIKSVDEKPSVDIHVTNEFQESGYLATTLDGQVERAYPYAR